MEKIFKIAIAAITFAALVWSCSEQPNGNEFTGDFGSENTQYRNTETKNLSPYAIFGDSSFVLLTEAERTGKHSLIISTNDTESIYSRFEIELKTGRVKAYDKKKNLVEDFILPSQVLARFISVDPRAEKYYGWSPYNYVLGNPILNIDPNGDTVRTTQEGYGFINNGLTATLGSSHPFGFDAASGNVTFDASFDRSQYNATQLDVIDRMSTVVTSTRINEARVVNYNDAISELGGQSLANFQFNGVTLTPKSGNGSIITYLARDPKVGGSVPNPNYNPQNLASQQYIPGLVNAPNHTRGVAAIHEIGGHANLRITQPSLNQAQHDLNVENFETSFRQVYQTGTYTKKRQVKRANKNGLNVKLGDSIYLRGKAKKH